MSISIIFLLAANNVPVI